MIDCFGKATVFPAAAAAFGFFLADLFFLELFFPVFWLMGSRAEHQW
jgi:hypothetical protein